MRLAVHRVMVHTAAQDADAGEKLGAAARGRAVQPAVGSVQTRARQDGGTFEGDLSEVRDE